MVTWRKYPNRSRRACLIWISVLAVLGIGPAPAHAANSPLQGLRTNPHTAITSVPRVKPLKPRRLAQRATQTTPIIPLNRALIAPSRRGNPTGGASGRGKGGTVILPGSLGVFPPRPSTPPSVVFPKPPPRPKPPAVWYPPKPPKVVKPRPRPGKSRTVRRRPPRKISPRIGPPPIVATIPQFIANEVLVFVKSDRAGAVGDELAAAFNLTKVESVPISLLEGSLIRFSFSGNRVLREVLSTLLSDPRVSQAQPNNWYQVVSRNKPKKAPPAQYTLAKLAIGQAQEISQGRGISIAVIDTGIDAKHPSLSKAIAASFDAVGDGKNAVGKHGTAIAGLIAGQGKVTGVAPLSKLLAARAFYLNRKYNKPMTSSMILLRALDWSFKNKARIFNMSFTGPYDPLVRTALDNAYKQGVILVAAAGNGGPKAPPAYPAAYRNVIAITALDSKDRLYPQANRGSYLTAAAPGVNLLVPSLKKGYTFSSGTSLAAAHISGLIALLLERNPEATSETIVDAIKTSARDLGPKGFDTQFGAGLADAYASLLSLASGSVKPTSGQ